MSQTTASNFRARAAADASRPLRALLPLNPSSDSPVSNARRMDFSSSTIRTCGFDILILRLLSRERQQQSEDGADSDFALHRNTASVQLGNVAHEGQTHAGPRSVRVLLEWQARHAIKLLEDQRDRLG